MTFPFLVSSVISAAVVAAVTAKLPSAATAQGKVWDESKLKPAKPGLPPPKIATLDKPFTLVYRLKVTDLRTPSMREAAIAERTQELTKEVDEDRKTQAQADVEIARMRAPARPRVETITLAFDGKTLFYEDRPDGGDDPRPMINLFDGKHTYLFQPRVAGAKYGSQGAREEGTVQYWTWNMPYIGPSFPFFPVTRGNETLILSAFDKRPVYGPYGSVFAGPKGAVGKILMGRFDPQESIELSAWKPLHGTVVARSIVRTRPAYQPIYADRDMGKPERRYEYTLVSARPSVDSARFSPDTYVEDGMEFTLIGGSRRLTLDRTKGTLEQQIATIMGSGQ